mgnify:CR=1 FL=1
MSALSAQARPVNEGRAPYQENTAQNDKRCSESIVSAIERKIQGQPGNPYWNAFDALCEITNTVPQRWPEHFGLFVHEAAIRERVRRGELGAI